MMEYKLLQSDTAKYLEKRVNECLENGFEPLGSPFAQAYHSGSVMFFQAVVRWDPPPRVVEKLDDPLWGVVHRSSDPSADKWEHGYK